MHWKLTSFAALSVVALAACKEEPPGNLTVNTTQGSNATGARAFFETNVFPELDKDQGKDPTTGKLRQACVNCHSVGESGAPIWLQASPEAAYSKLDGYESPYGSQLIAIPDNSELLLHGEHTGPALSKTQELLIRDWLELEVEERGLAVAGAGGAGSTSTGSGPPSKTVAEALEEWGNCMSLEDWTTTGMDKLFNQQTVGSGACNGCHSTGQAGAFLSDNTGDTLEANRHKPYMLKMVIGKVGSNGAFQDLVPAERFIDKGSEGCTLEDTALCHPVYALETTTLNAVTNFFAKTKAKYDAGPCTPGGVGGGGGGGGLGGGGGAGGGQ